MIRNIERTQQLEKIIHKNPGIQFREIMRKTGWKNGVLSHYLEKLEQQGSVQVNRRPRVTRFYPLHISENESKVISALRRTTPRDILSALVFKQNMDFSEIVSFVKKSPSTVSLYLSQLVEDGIIRCRLNDRKKTYQISDTQIVDKLIDDYHPGLLEKPVDGFEDIINSL